MLGQPFMYFINTFDVCVNHYSKKFPKLKVYLSCFGALYHLAIRKCVVTSVDIIAVVYG